MTLSTMVQRLQRKVDQDWEGSTVVVSATDQAIRTGFQWFFPRKRMKWVIRCGFQLVYEGL